MKQLPPARHEVGQRERGETGAGQQPVQCCNTSGRAGAGEFSAGELSVGQGDGPSSHESGQQGQKGSSAGRPPSGNISGKHDMVAREGFNERLWDIYAAAVGAGTFNYMGARERVPSGLNIEAWRTYLQGYEDANLVDFLAFGWPINCQRVNGLVTSAINHPSADNFPEHVEYYIATELGHEALAGPFSEPPVDGFHASPLMTRPKKDAQHRRVIVDLSWPDGGAVNDGIPTDWYIDGPATIRLPTADYMAGRLLELGNGAFMYKTDLARGYRQLRVDPLDWPLLGFRYGGRFFMDVCPPFGLRSAAMCMQRTSQAIAHIHKQRGFYSRPYLDDFGGAESSEQRADEALATLQGVLRDLGVAEAVHKVCRPAQEMVWLGILYNSVEMTMVIPPAKLEEVMQVLKQWEGRFRATRSQMQSLLGLLQFVASVTPPARLFTNRMLQNLRDTPRRGSETLSLGFKKDLKFFLDLLPHYNGVRIIAKEEVQGQQELELDACLTGCGAFEGTQYYATPFPDSVIQQGHTIAHLEFLNIVVAVKVWAQKWEHHKVRIHCDNSNAVLAMQSGRSRDPFIQNCARELFLYGAMYDIDIKVVHVAGRLLVRADALSRMHTAPKFREWVRSDRRLQAAERLEVPDRYFELVNEL